VKSVKIATITLNPAVDQTVRVSGFTPGRVNRGQSMHVHAGGKGINVATFLAASGFSVSATGFLGMENAPLFEEFFAARGIEDNFVRLPGATRIDIKIVDEGSHQTTDINLPGLAPSPEALAELEQVIERLAPSCSWFVLAGTLPPGAPPSLYARLITRLKQLGKSTVLDASGEALAQGLLAGPTLVKPNRDELQQLLGRPLQSNAEIEQAARRLLAQDVRRVVVSLGEQGALFVERERTVYATPPQVAVTSTVGAGDAMVAALVVGELRGLDLTECARLATAYALARITQIGPGSPSPELVQSYSDRVQVATTIPVPSP
jgi:1-phosphofructokinase